MVMGLLQPHLPTPPSPPPPRLLLPTLPPPPPPLLAYALVSGLFRNPFVSSRILLLASSASDLSFSRLLFTHIPKPNLFSYNTIIRALAESPEHHPGAAFEVYDEMLQRGARPDKYTFPFLLKACRCPLDLHLCKSAHTHLLVLGFDIDPFVQTELMNMYFLCGSLHDARRVFDEMSVRDVVVWTAMISGLCSNGLYRNALEVFIEMRGSDPGVDPNVATMVSTMSACANLGSLEHAKCLHAYAEKVGVERNAFVRKSLIDLYAKCGGIILATQVFNKMNERDLLSWTAMISGLASHGFGKEALKLFSNMIKAGTSPDSTTFIAVLSACSHAGLVDEAITIFGSMEKVYNVTPEIKHYGCMVDLFSRAGLLSHAYEFIANMPFEPNLTILGALLSACRVHKNLEIGELVVKKIESICRHKGGANVLLSNIYADQCQWHEVAAVRERARRDASKPPGQSWIGVNGCVHEFMVKDRSHPLSVELHLLLDGLGKLMEELI
uniref:Pentatricopeptide repeat-containing protein n=1 Tax=Ananas comosus var. bracteatus TaxID=296719 RepID=A0A6V7PMP6_ANACO|nr:unnamed protein product [Ananas comosus var. bracteatus]